MVLLTNRIAESGATETHGTLIRIHSIPKKSLYEVHCGPAVSSVHIFFENAEVALTVNGEPYRAIITDFFTVGSHKTTCQLCHTARNTPILLHEKLQSSVISRGGDINWPHRSCDLTPIGKQLPTTGGVDNLIDND